LGKRKIGDIIGTNKNCKMQNNYDFLLEIRESEVIQKNVWQKAFELHNQLWFDSFHTIGFYKFLGLDDVQSRLSNEFIRANENQCPYLGERVGFIGWSWWPDFAPIYNLDEDCNERERMVLEWLDCGGSFITSADSEQSFSFVKMLNYPLKDVFDSRGFDYGEAFLSNADKSYWIDIQKIVVAELKKCGIERSFDSHYSTGSKNPLYIRELADLNKIENQYIQFWGSDVKILETSEWQKFLFEKS